MRQRERQGERDREREWKIEGNKGIQREEMKGVDRAEDRKG